MLTVYAIEKSEIYGHGQRAVIWFSGCTLQCEGCVNSNLWDRSAGKKYSVNDLLNVVKGISGITGVTYIGGEPLQQGKELLRFTKAVLKQGLDLVLFTGYELNELNVWQHKIVALSAAVICGRYISALRDTCLLLRGSGNQQIIVNDKALLNYYSEERRQVEVEITAEEDKFLGFPEDFI